MNWDEQRHCGESDFDSLSRSLQSLGWVRVDLSRFQDNYHAIDIREWVRDNIQHNYHSLGRHWIFQCERDALLFTLRWT